MSGEIVQTEIIDSGYGKKFVKLLQLRREGKIHYVKEVEVNTELTLNNHRDYLFGDNSDIVATDSQKNTVYILARQYGIQSIEQFAILLCNHFLNKYQHVVATKVYIEEAPWKRIEIDGQEHVHAYLLSKTCTRFCEIKQKRNEIPHAISGLKDLRVMKTTMSAFKTFVNDEYRTLPDVDDRLFCTVVEARWWYSTVQNVDFDKAWEGVKTSILKVFAGAPDTGIFSPSVQNTLYLAEKEALANIPHIDKIEMTLPNVHYFSVDFNRFPKLEFSGCQNEIYMPTDKPSGNIRAAIQRKPSAKL
ncbi:hypothetical protein ACJMK2_039241 [Sinanodonta woodiana]|uniref:Uricase n=1 Tax=Sinanodonta woodiana TaxID=1069815 RepID=A0ABD3WDE6_SINWO